MRWTLKAGENLNERRLAGAISPKHSHPFTHPDAKRDVIQDAARADFRVELLYNPIRRNRSVSRRCMHRAVATQSHSVRHLPQQNSATSARRLMSRMRTRIHRYITSDNVQNVERRKY